MEDLRWIVSPRSVLGGGNTIDTRVLPLSRDGEIVALRMSFEALIPTLRTISSGAIIYKRGRGITFGTPFLVLANRALDFVVTTSALTSLGLHVVQVNATLNGGQVVGVNGLIRVHNTK